MTAADYFGGRDVIDSWSLRRTRAARPEGRRADPRAHRRRRGVRRAQRHRLHVEARADALRRHERALPRPHGRAALRRRRHSEGLRARGGRAQRREPRQAHRHALRGAPAHQAHLLVRRGRTQGALPLRRQARARRKAHASRLRRHDPQRGRPPLRRRREGLLREARVPRLRRHRAGDRRAALRCRPRLPEGRKPREGGRRGSGPARLRHGRRHGNTDAEGMPQGRQGQGRAREDARGQGRRDLPGVDDVGQRAAPRHRHDELRRVSAPPGFAGRSRRALPLSAGGRTARRGRARGQARPAPPP